MGFYRDSITAALVIFLISNTVAVAARLYTRLRITKSFGLDDATLCLCYVGFIIVCGMGFTAFHYGYAAEDEKPYSTLEPWYDPAKAKKFYFANQLTLYIDSGIIKLAVGLVLLRLAVTKSLRIVIMCAMGVVVVWTIVMTVYASYLCAAKGTSNYAGSKTCNVVGYFRTTTNVIIDYFFSLLPVYMLWNVKMRLLMKLSVMVLLGLGILASASTIVKLVIIVRLNHAKGLNVEHQHYQLLLWADIELGLAIFVASLAAVRPLLSKLHVPGLTKLSSNRASYGRRVAGSSTDATGPYKEIQPGSLSANNGQNPHENYIQRDVVIDVESHEMGALDFRDGQRHEARAAVWAKGGDKDEMAFGRV